MSSSSTEEATALAPPQASPLTKWERQSFCEGVDACDYTRKQQYYGGDAIIPLWDIILYNNCFCAEVLKLMFESVLGNAHLLFLVLFYDQILYSSTPPASNYRITFINSGRVATHNNWFHHVFTRSSLDPFYWFSILILDFLWFSLVHYHFAPPNAVISYSIRCGRVLVVGT